MCTSMYPPTSWQQSSTQAHLNPLPSPFAAPGRKSAARPTPSCQPSPLTPLLRHPPQPLLTHSEVTLLPLHLSAQRPQGLSQQVDQQIKAAAMGHTHFNAPHPRSSAAAHQGVQPRQQRLTPLQPKPAWREQTRAVQQQLTYLMCSSNSFAISSVQDSPSAAPDLHVPAHTAPRARPPPPAFLPPTHLLVAGNLLARKFSKVSAASSSCSTPAFSPRLRLRRPSKRPSSQACSSASHRCLYSRARVPQ